MFKIINNVNKKSIFSLLLVSILAIFAISMIGSVSAYTLSDDGKTVTIDLSSASTDYILDLGNGKGLHVKTYFMYSSRVINITALNTSKIVSATIYGKDKHGFPYSAGTFYVGGTGGQSFSQTDNSIRYSAWTAGGTPYKATITFTETLKPKVTNTGVNAQKADLKITKITKKGNFHYITVKNLGKKTAGKNKLGIYVGKNKIKTLNVKSLDSGKSTTIKVLLPKKHRNVMKSFKADIFNVITEISKKNNVLKAR